MPFERILAQVQGHCAMGAIAKGVWHGRLVWYTEPTGALTRPVMSKLLLSRLRALAAAMSWACVLLRFNLRCAC